MTLMHDFSGGEYDDVTVPDVTVNIVENDDPGITLSTNALEVREGSSRTYTVKLDAQPVANVDGGDPRWGRRGGESAEPDVHTPGLEQQKDGNGGGRA